MKQLLIILFVCAIGYTQTFTQTSANTKIDGRSINKSVLFVDCPHVGDSVYTDTGGVDIDSMDYAPKEIIRGLLLTGGTGNIGLTLAGGGRMVIPYTVDADYSVEAFRGWQIRKILTDSVTTFTGRIFPLF